LGVHTTTRPLGEDVDLGALAKMSVGFSGADLQNWCNEASIYAAREGGVATVALRHFDAAFEKITIGEERSTMLVTEEKRRLVAFHESGHALMALLVNDFDSVRKVSILPRGRTGGVTAFLPKEENLDGGGLVTREYLENRIMVALGGRIAEEIIYGWDRVTTGAAGDIQEVYNLAHRMVVTYGMSRRLGPVNWDNGAGNKENIQEEVRWMVDRLYHRASDLMMSNVFYLHRLAEALLEKETLEWEDVQWCTTGISCSTV
jgi:cell division protease FtsH